MTRRTSFGGSTVTLEQMDGLVTLNLMMAVSSLKQYYLNVMFIGPCSYRFIESS